MQRKLISFFVFLLTGTFILTSSGCTVIFQKGRRNDAEQITKLQGDIDELQKAKEDLENRLKGEIADKEVTVERLQKGLVITFVSEVLFDSGKAELKNDSLAKLDKIVSVLSNTVPDLDVGIEGHTDNVPIKHSSWKSNWELSSHRALSVLHYLTEQKVDPKRLAAIGYGEYRPVTENDSKEGRQKNRRVEIVILPKTDKKKSEEVSN